jgi:hypothetical protein
MDNGCCAIVQKVFQDGQHGPYAKASTKTLGTITFSLEPPVWEEKRFPEEGTYVILSGLTKKRAGWRADAGRFFRPSDEQTGSMNQRSTGKGDERCE